MAVLAGCVIGLTIIHPTSAAEQPATPPPAMEFNLGADATRRSWVAYTSSTVALAWPSEESAADIRADGWRLRGGGGYWGYRDHTTRKVGTAYTRVPERGSASFADALLGYQLTTGPLTVKLFAGLAYRDERWEPADVRAKSAGGVLGARALVESWLTLSPAAFAQLDLSWSEVSDAISARGRFGYRLSPWFSLGPEVSWWRSDGEEMSRLAGFARIEWSRGELSLSAGLTAPGTRDQQPYGAISVLFRR